MALIDERLVSLVFDNSKFNNNVDDSVKKIDELKKGLDFKGVEAGLQTLQGSVSNISSKFSAFGIAGITAIQSLTNSAINFAKTLATSVIDPIVKGGMKRAENIEQAKFMFKGLMKSSYDWGKIEKDLMYAVKDTAYGLDDAAKAASSLYASGVKLTAENGKMGSSLRAISGVAAMTGSEYSDIANIFTRVAGQGRVMAVDLNSLAARGLNVAADLADSFDTTEAKIRDMVSKGKISFEQLAAVMDLKYGEHAKKANETYSGAMKNMYAALSRVGAKFATEYLDNMRDIFNAVSPQIDAISKAMQPVIDVVNKGFKSATKTLVDFIGTFKFVGEETKPVAALIAEIGTKGKVTTEDFRKLASGGKNAVGALAKSMGVSEKAIWKMASKGKISIADFNKAMEDSRPRSDFEQGMESLASVAEPLTGFFNQLGIVTQKVMNYMAAGSGDANTFAQSVNYIVNPIKGLIDSLRVALVFLANDGVQLQKFATILQGFGAFLHIVWSIAIRFGQVIAEVFGGSQMAGFGQGFIDFAEKIGAWLIATDKAINEGHKLDGFFKVLKDTLGNIPGFIGGITDSIKGFFDKIGGFSASDQVQQVGEFVNTINKYNQVLGSAFRIFGSIMQAAWNDMQPVFKFIWDATATTRDMITQMIKALTISDVSAGFAVGGLSVIGAVISRFLGNLGNTIKVAAGIRGQIAQLFTNLGTTIKAQILTISAGALVKIAIAIGILAGSLLLMSLIEPGRMYGAVSAMAGLMGGILMMMKTMDDAKVSVFNIWKFDAISNGILQLALAITILAQAVKIMGSMGWEELAKGIGGVAALLVSLAIFSKYVDADKLGATKGAGIVLLAVAINVLANAFKIFATMSWEELAKGAASMAACLGIIAGAMNLMPKEAKLMSMGAAMVSLGIGMILLGAAFKIFATMSWEDIAKGAIGMAAGIGIVVAAMNLLPKDARLMSMAAALIGIGIAMNLMGAAFLIFGGMSWEEIGKAGVVLSGALIILAIGLAAMEESMAGAAALIVAAAALAILAPALILLGSMSWEMIAQGLVALAGSLAIIALAGIALEYGAVGLLALGAAALMLGAGVALAGAGIGSFAKGLILLGAALTAFMPAIKNAVTEFITMFPQMAASLADAMVAMLVSFANNADEVAAALVKLIQSLLAKGREVIPDIIAFGVEIIVGLLDGIQTVIPKVVETAAVIILALLRGMEVLIPRIVATGMKILNGILDGIGKNIKKTVEKGTKIVTEFIDGVAEGLPKIIESGANLVVKFLNGIADAIEKHAEEIGRAGGRIAGALIDGMIRGIGAGHQEIMNKIGQLATDAIDWAKKLLGIHSPSKVFKEIGEYVTQGFVDGITGGIPWSAPIKSEIEEAFNTLRDNLDSFIKDTEKDIKSAQASLKKLNKHKKKNAKKIKQTKAEIAQDKAELAKAKAAQKALEEQRAAEEEHLKKLNAAYEENTTQLNAAIDLLNARNQYAESLRNTYGAIPDLMKNDSYTEALNKVTVTYNDLVTNIDSAQKALEDIQKTMDDTAKSIKDQYSKIPGMGEDTNFSSFTKDLENQIAATEKYTQSLQVLRSLGVDDATYATLVSQGPAGQAFVDQLIEAGPDGLSKIKDLYSQLGDAATNLGNMVSQDFYKSGENAAQAVVDGLMSQEASARAAVEAASTDYVSGFEADIQKQIEANNQIAKDLATLRQLGLSDSAYAELVSKGTNAQPFITDLLKKGAAGVSQLNILIGNLDASATALGNQAADELYRVGEQTAQGLVDGLKAKRKEIEDEMNAIAASLVETLKKLLDIHSPSRVFMSLGGYISQGLAEGIQNQNGLVKNASTDLGNTATNTLRKSLSDMTEMLSADISSNPTITPVLDLTTFRKDAASMNSMVGPMTVGTTYQRASNIAIAERELREQLAASIEEAANVPVGDEITFNQYNNSPKALSNSEIYRRTSNQISSIKGVSRR